MSTQSSFLFPPPASIFVSAMSVVIIFMSLVSSGFEIRGHQLRYSKFWDAGGGGGVLGVKQIGISSKAGMLLFYSPAMSFTVAAPFLFAGLVDGIRARLLDAALVIHFSKRIFEVLFIHKYSGQMMLDSAITVSLGYFLSTVTIIYAQHLTQNMVEPAMDFKYVGFVLFLVGISGNFYHHFLLSKLRVKGEKVYKIPKGGLFEFVICPHYLFEIIAFIGLSLISQTVYAFCFTIGSAIYLIGRSYVTRQWYLNKFDDFPRNVKALILCFLMQRFGYLKFMCNLNVEFLLL